MNRNVVVSRAGLLMGLLTVLWPVTGDLQAVASDLYVSSTYAFATPIFSVKRFSGSTPVGLDGTFATSDGLSFPRGLAFGPDGNLYVASEGTDNILKYDGATGAYLSEFIASGAGGGPFTDGLKAPKGIAFGPDGNLYVASNGAPNAVLKFNGVSGAFIDDLTDPFPGGVSLSTPWGVAFGPDGKLYVSGFGSGNVVRFDPVAQTLLGEFIGIGSGGLTVPRGLTFGPDGNLYVTSETIASTSGQVLKYDGTTGAFVGVFVTAGSGGLGRPDGIVFGPDGNLYVSSGDSQSVLQYNGTTGAFLDVFAALDYPLALGPAGLAFYPVPEPSSLVLAAGGAALLILRWRSKRRFSITHTFDATATAC